MSQTQLLLFYEVFYMLISDGKISFTSCMIIYIDIDILFRLGFHFFRGLRDNKFNSTGKYHVWDLLMQIG